MKILITGASGFIGGRLRAALLARGHEVIGVARSKPARSSGAWLKLDVSSTTVDEWRPHLNGVDAVVNAVGIFRESGRHTFQSLHVDAAKRLFDACAIAGVERVVQLSALGADEGAVTAYHRSKRTADEFLLGLGLSASVVQPSLVFGAHGTSARMFLAWASLPLLPLPAGGRQQVQPVHVDDLVQAMVRLIDRAEREPPATRIAIVGPRSLAFVDYLQGLRAAMHMSPAPTVSIPSALMSVAARVGDVLPGMLFNSEAWQMLKRGNVAPMAATTALLGHEPRPAERFIEDDDAALIRRDARMSWLLPLLRLSLAIVWIITGIVSLGLYPLDDSLELLARAGVPRALQAPMLYGAAAFDLALGIATLVPLPRRRWLWLVQAALILFYTAVITLRLPEFWLHPYGPVLKNIPILAILLVLAMLEPVRRRS